MDSESVMEQIDNSILDSNEQVAAYEKQRQRANERKRKFLDNMTPEQKELKKAKDREYNHRRKGVKKKSIKDLTEKEKEGVRSMWRRNSKSYRERQKAGTSNESSEQCASACDLEMPSCSDINTDDIIVWDADFEPEIGSFTALEPELGGHAALEPEPGGYAALEPELGGHTALEPEPGGYAALEPELGDYAALEPELGGYAALEPELEDYAVFEPDVVGSSVIFDFCLDPPPIINESLNWTG